MNVCEMCGILYRSRDGHLSYLCPKCRRVVCCRKPAIDQFRVHPGQRESVGWPDYVISTWHSQNREDAR